MNDWKDNLFTGEIFEPKQLHYYLQNHPHKTLGDTLKVLAIEESPSSSFILYFSQNLAATVRRFSYSD
ncbi:hypothetical protein [Crocosphaera subtropica]|nr:hypothetical protein [Crocosphaera subtropica]